MREHPPPLQPLHEHQSAGAAAEGNEPMNSLPVVELRLSSDSVSPRINRRQISSCRSQLDLSPQPSSDRLSTF